MIRVAIVLFLTGTVAAAPRVDLDRCVAFDAAELARAIDRELPVDVGAHAYVVVVQCPDLVTAVMQVTPVPASGALARQLDLGEVPTDLRLKLLALAVAEMVKVAATLPEPIAQPAQPASGPVLVAPTRKPPPPPPPPPHVIEVIRTVHEPLSLSLSPRVGMKMFEMTPTHPLATVGAEVSSHSFRVGVEGGYGQRTLQYGRIRAWLATATVAYERCDKGTTTWCFLVRGELGEAGTDVALNNTSVFTAENLQHLYLQIGPAVELAQHFDHVTLVAALDVGYGWGLIADTTDDGRAFAMAGLVGGLQLGARWP